MVRISKYIYGTIVSLMVLLTLIGCGGGGGGDNAGGGSTPAPTVPTVVNYAIGPSVNANVNIAPINGSSASGMTFTLLNDSTHSFHFAGTFNTQSKEVTLPTNYGMSFTVSPDPTVGGTSSVTIGILVPGSGVTAQWVLGNDATAGDFQIWVNDANPIYVHVVDSNTVTVTSANIPSPLSLSWADFNDAVTSGKQPHDVVYASLGYNGLQTIYRYAFQAYEMLKLALENEQQIQKQSPYGLTETGLSGYPASLSITWGDTDHNSSIDPGDSFLFRLVNWYEPGNNGGQSYIYGGRLLLVDYWNIQNSGTTTVGGNFQFSPAGVTDPNEAFSGEEVNNGAPDTGTKITMEGGMLFTLTFPD